MPRSRDPARNTTPIDDPIVNLNNGLVNQQFYGAAMNASGIVVAGAQDIGTLHRGTDGTWTSFLGCDGAAGADGTTTAADPTASDLFYFGNSRANLFRSSIFGADSIVQASSSPPHDAGCLGATPILLDPLDPNTLYVGCERLWRSVNVTTAFAAQIVWSIIK